MIDLHSEVVVLDDLLHHLYGGEVSKDISTRQHLASEQMKP